MVRVISPKNKGGSALRVEEVPKLLKKYNAVNVREDNSFTIYCNKITEKWFAVCRHDKEVPAGTLIITSKYVGINY